MITFLQIVALFVKLFVVQVILGPFLFLATFFSCRKP